MPMSCVALRVREQCWTLSFQKINTSSKFHKVKIYEKFLSQNNFPASGNKFLAILMRYLSQNYINPLRLTLNKLKMLQLKLVVINR